MQIPVGEGGACGCGHCSCDRPRDSMVSCISVESDTSCDSHTRTLLSVKDSPLNKKRSGRHKLSGPSPANSPKFSALKEKAKNLVSSSSIKNSLENIPMMSHHGGSKVSLTSHDSVEKERVKLKWEEGDLFVADIILRKVAVHCGYFTPPTGRESDSADSAPPRRPLSATASKESSVSCQSSTGSESGCRGSDTKTDPIDGSETTSSGTVTGSTEHAQTTTVGTVSDPTKHAQMARKKEEEERGKSGEKNAPCVSLREKKNGESESKVVCLFHRLLYNAPHVQLCHRLAV